MEIERKTVRQLFPSLCFEMFCFILAGAVDTLMLSSVGDDAVGAVGTANTYISVFIIMFSIISSGMIAVVTQFIGAKQYGIAYQAKNIGLIFNGSVGIVFSLFMIFGADVLLDVIGIAPSLMGYAKTYIQIVGGGCILNAIIPIYSSYLRAFGYTKEPMKATIAANVFNLIMNAFFLFVLDMGVAGVAIATTLSKVINLAVVMLVSRHLSHMRENPERLKNLEILRKIIKIGFPAAMETALYNFAMTLIIRFLNQMDEKGLNVTARSYANLISNIAFCMAAALSQANSIVTGWRIGAGEFEECYKGTIKTAKVGVVLSVSMAGVVAFFGKSIIGLFSDNPEMISLVATLLFIDIFLEIGRSLNMVFGQALKTSGDALYTTIIASIFMYLCAVGGTYFFGIRLGMLVVGCYIALALDECVRAFFMYLRWRSGKWKEKGLVQKEM